jgi:hypothetical protein
MPDKEFDEVMETTERTKYQILARVVSVPGKKTYVADWMQQTYVVLLEAYPTT